MKSVKMFLATAGMVLALFSPVLLTQGVRAAEIEPCSPDLATSKQVKISGGSFVDAPDQASAPSTTVGSKVEWKLTVTKNTTGICDGVGIGGTVVIHDALPTNLAYVSAVGDGSYDSSSNNWSFNASLLNVTDSVSIVVTTTASQTGVFENIITLSNIVYEGEQEPLVIDYGQSGDQNSQNNSASAWVNIQAGPQVLGETAPQVLADSVVATGNSAAFNIVAGFSLLLGLSAVWYFSRKAKASL